MDMIIFGAGASFGSDTSNTPPLGDGLPDSLIRFSPDVWGRLSTEQKESFRSDFEQGMQQLSNSNPHMMPPLQRAMAAYFFQFVPTQSNLYRKLSRKIKQSKWKGALATFNYERLLELSLIEEGLQPVVGSGTNAPDQVEICLPHGCCHIFCESVHGMANAVSLSGPNVATSGSIRAISNPAEFNSRIENDAFPPVMSYFEPQKRTTSGINFVTDQRNRYNELVLGSSRIVIIGLKVRPHDTHIWNSLAETQATLIYCSGREGGSEFQKWTAENRKNKANRTFDGCFDYHFDEICEELDI